MIWTWFCISMTLEHYLVLNSIIYIKGHPSLQIRSTWLIMWICACYMASLMWNSSLGYALCSWHLSCLNLLVYIYEGRLETCIICVFVRKTFEMDVRSVTSLMMKFVSSLWIYRHLFSSMHRICKLVISEISLSGSVSILEAYIRWIYIWIGVMISMLYARLSKEYCRKNEVLLTVKIYDLRLLNQWSFFCVQWSISIWKCLETMKVNCPCTLEEMHSSMKNCGTMKWRKICPCCGALSYLWENVFAEIVRGWVLFKNIVEEDLLYV